MMLTVLLILQVLDVATTIIVLRRGGEELNPIMAFFQKKLGRVAGTLAPKVAFIALVLWFQDQIAPAVFVVLIVLYAAVVFNNVRAMRKQ